MKSIVLSLGTLLGTSHALNLSLRGNDVTNPMAPIVHAEFPTVPELEESNIVPPSNRKVAPVVFAHGMGDSCFNPGMQSITESTAKHMNTYGTCIGDGNDQASDTIGGFLVNLDDAAASFAKKVRSDPKLRNGFNAVGFSQGNDVIRGYMQQYNNPPVLSWVSVHGPVAGVASLPRCAPGTSGGLVHKLCQLATDLVSKAAYTDTVQKKITQSNFLRDPENIDQFLGKCIWLARMNNECQPNSEYKSNFLKTKNILLIKALRDTMIFPSESEWFGAYEDGNYKKILKMEETKWYKEDLFGLKTMHKRGSISFGTTPGNHLQFYQEDLFGWAEKAFV